MVNGIVRCLVADDHPALRQGLGRVIEAEDGLEVVGEARDGTQALALTERRRPDIAVVDIEMPRMGGLEYCRRVREAGEQPQVIVYTAHDDVKLLDEALEAGARGFVLKTGPMADVVQAIRSVMSGRPYIDGNLTSSLLDRRDGESADGLSKREGEVLQLLADGLPTEAVAEHLYLSPATVRSYAEAAMHKVEGRNRVHAVANALRAGLIR
jgi:DNA-binding NarL/FixJ family response regulator